CLQTDANLPLIILTIKLAIATVLINSEQVARDHGRELVIPASGKAINLLRFIGCLKLLITTGSGNNQLITPSELLSVSCFVDRQPHYLLQTESERQIKNEY